MTIGILQEAYPRQPNARQLAHVEAIKQAFETLRGVMHRAEGTNLPGDVEDHIWSSHRMRQAAYHLEIAEMFATKAAVE